MLIVDVDQRGHAIMNADSRRVGQTELKQQLKQEPGLIEQTGGCACHAVRFRVTAKPRRVSLCHCMTCRRIHGSAFAAFAMFARDAVEFSGPLQAWQSSSEGRRYFCPTCGSVAYMEEVGNDEVDIPLGAFDQPGLYEPTYELWCCHKEPWLPQQVRTEYEGDRIG